MTNPSRKVAAALVIIGDEILSGRTVDKNLSYLANWLNEAGVQLSEVRVVADDETAIVEAVNACRASYDYVFTTGGIGPTHDDITAECIARAFGVEVVESDEALAIMTARHGGGMNEARRKMASVPLGATLIENRVSGAPGFQMENVFVLAGIPAVMQAMLESLRDRIEGATPVRSATVIVYAPESKLAADVAAVHDGHEDVSLGSYPFFRDGIGGAEIVVRSVDEAALAAAVLDLKARLEASGLRFEDLV